MWQFLFGLASGVYIGTYYNFKPGIETIIKFAKSNFPKNK